MLNFVREKTLLYLNAIAELNSNGLPVALDDKVKVSFETHPIDFSTV